MTRADDRQFLRLAGLALPAAVLGLCLVTPPRGGVTATYVVELVALLGALALVDQTAPDSGASRARRLLWLAAEIGLCFAVVRLHGTLVRPALIYVLPASRALLSFEGRRGFVASLAVWLAYGGNVLFDVWPDRLSEIPNYFSLFLAFYVVGAVLTLAALRQAADRRRVEALYVELQELHTQAREAAVAEERNRLAREIHDTLAHYLTVINVQLEAAEKLAGQPERAQEQVRRARRLALDSLQEVRRSVAALRAATLEELSLPRSLRKLAAEFAENTGIPVEVELELPDDARLSPEAGMALYRAAQEALTNVQRHAHASAVRLSLARENGHLAMAVEDDGIGPGESQSGFGMVGMRERVELLGGEVRFGPGAARGSRLVVQVPT